LRELEDEAKEELDASIQNTKQTKCVTYKGLVQPDGRVWHGKPHHAVLEIMCQINEAAGHHHFCCVLRDCESCPKFPTPAEEHDSSENAPKIKFDHYEHITKCTIDGLLPLQTKQCDSCEVLDEGEKCGKVTTQKELTIRTHEPSQLEPSLLNYIFRCLQSMRIT
jgi:hypothetical protein